MSRWWVDLVAAISDRIPLPVLILIMLVVAGLVSVLWYTFPAWVPRRWPRWRWPRWFSRRRRGQADATGEEDVPEEVPSEPDALSEELPDLSALALGDLADQLAARGRYAEAVRERLRAVVRAMVEVRLIEYYPGQTIMELADLAGNRHHLVDAPLRDACHIFSDIWYGKQPATSEDDTRMRDVAAQVEQALTTPASEATVEGRTS